jgi:hypothetical protein
MVKSGENVRIAGENENNHYLYASKEIQDRRRSQRSQENAGRKEKRN